MRSRTSRTADSMQLHGLLLRLLAVALTMHSAAAADEALVEGRAPGKALVHSIITSGCGKYFDWQVMGLVYSFKRVGQDGPLTRLMACTKEELEAYTPLDVVDTYIAPSFAKDSAHSDDYPPYNKPGAVTHWLRFAEPEEPYVLIMDSDIIMRRRYVPEELRVRPGWATAPYFDFLHGVNNQLARTHLPEGQPRHDTYMGPEGRLADMAGAPYFITKEDLKVVAPQWSSFTRKVRNDPTAFNLTGDMHTRAHGDKPWIAEMYGYVLGAAKANVWHNPADYFHWMYPGYFTSEPPRILHYGLLWEVKNQYYFFDKAWYHDFDPLQCPPWNLTDERPAAGLFPQPPAPATFKRFTGLFLLKLLLAIEPIVVLNGALCEHHLRHCPISEQLLSECRKVADLEHELDDVYDDLEPVLRNLECKDDNVECKGWAEGGYCETNPNFMLGATDLGPGCRKSCRRCHVNTGIETRSRVGDEGVEGGGTQSRSVVDVLLEQRSREAQSWVQRAFHIAPSGEGAAGQRRQPRPLPRLEQDLADALAVQAADSIGNVRLRVQQKAAAAAAEGGARSSKAVVGRRGKLRVQVKDEQGRSALRRYALQLHVSDYARVQASLRRLRWLGLSIGLLWGALILAFLAVLRWRGSQAAGGAVKDSKSTE